MLGILNLVTFPSHGTTDPVRTGSAHYRVFTFTLKHIALDRTPLNERSARCSLLCYDMIYLTAIG